MGSDGNALTLDTPTLVVRSQMDTKHDIRAESCSRGNRLLAQPANATSVGVEGNGALYAPKKVIQTRKTAGITLEDVEWSGRNEARNLAKVESPMPKRAPVMLRMVASKCWASVSWAEKTSSLSVRSKKAEGPPNRDQGLTTRTRQHSKVESRRARTRRVKKSEMRLKIWAIQSKTWVWGEEEESGAN